MSLASFFQASYRIWWASRPQIKISWVKQPTHCPETFGRSTPPRDTSSSPPVLPRSTCLENMNGKYLYSLLQWSKYHYYRQHIFCWEKQPLSPQSWAVIGSLRHAFLHTRRMQVLETVDIHLIFCLIKFDQTLRYQHSGILRILWRGVLKVSSPSRSPRRILQEDNAIRDFSSFNISIFRLECKLFFACKLPFGGYCRVHLDGPRFFNRDRKISRARERVRYHTIAICCCWSPCVVADGSSSASNVAG